MPVEDIVALADHVSIVVTEKVYRHELRPMLRTGAKKKDEIFPDLQLTGPWPPGSRKRHPWCGWIIAGSAGRVFSEA